MPNNSASYRSSVNSRVSAINMGKSAFRLGAVIIGAGIGAGVCLGSRLPAAHAQQAADAPSRQAIEGGVSGTAVTFTQGLNYISGASRNVLQLSDQIMQEAARQDTVVVRGPNVLPNGTVIQPLGGVGGVVQMGNMPIHRDKLERWVAQMQEHLDLARNYVDSLIVPPETQAAAAPTYEHLRTTMQLAVQHFAVLQDLSKRPQLSNGKILKQAYFLQRDMKDLDAQRKALNAIVDGTANDGTAATTVTKHTVTDENKTTNGSGSSSSTSTSTSSSSSSTSAGTSTAP